MKTYYYKLVQKILNEYCRLLDIDEGELLTSRYKPRPAMRLVFAKVIIDEPNIAIRVTDIAEILRMKAHGTLLRGISNLNFTYDDIKLYKKIAIRALHNIWYEDKQFDWDSNERIVWHLKASK